MGRIPTSLRQPGSAAPGRSRRAAKTPAVAAFIAAGEKIGHCVDATYSEENLRADRADGLTNDPQTALATLRAIKEFAAGESTIILHVLVLATSGIDGRKASERQTFKHVVREAMSHHHRLVAAVRISREQLQRPPFLVGPSP
jgi:hypothetical protein